MRNWQFYDLNGMLWLVLSFLIEQPALRLVASLLGIGYIIAGLISKRKDDNTSEKK